MRGFCIYDLDDIHNSIRDNAQSTIKTINSTEKDFYICPEKGKGIIIGFTEPELDNTFDRNKEHEYLCSLGLECEYEPDGYNSGSRKINSIVNELNSIPGHIKSFIMYAIIGGEVNEFIVSRTISNLSTGNYVVNPINVTPMSDWDKYTIQNGNFEDKTPSILIVNSS
jgi:hypothetical protein